MGSTKWMQIKFPSPEVELCKPGQKPLTGVEAGIFQALYLAELSFSVFLQERV